MEFYSYEDNSMWALHEIADYYNLMQFTWLKDKNWKEIYEWDICKQIDPYNQNFDIEFWVDFLYQIHSLMVWDNENKLEVIWNIFENPELLETNQTTTS